ncbi:hypothetical protein D3C87_628450 [compost metagenome]
MADFDLEQMRMIFQGLADKLANTKGDESIVEKLKVIEKAIKGLEKKQGDQSKKSKADSKRENDQFIKDFVKEFDNASVLKGIKQAIEEQGANGAGPGQGALNLDPKDFQKFSSKLGGSLLAFGKLTSAMGNGTAKLVDNFGNLNGSFRGLANAAGITSGAIATMAAVLDDRADAYRAIVDSAEGTIGSLKDLGQAMHVSSLSADEFAQAMAKGTQGTRLLGGLPWAQLYGSIKDQTRAMGFYGYTAQGLLQAQNQYLDILSSRGDIFNTGQKDLVDGLNSLLLVNNKTAQILGKTRDEALQAQMAAARDADTQSYLMGLNLKADQKLAAENAIATAQGMSPELGKIFQDMFRLNGGMNTDTAQIAALLPSDTLRRIDALADAVRQGAIASEDVPKMWQEVAKSYQDNISSQQQMNTGILSAVQGAGEQFSAFNRLNQGMYNVKQDKDITADPTDPNRQDAGTIAILQANDTIRNMGAAVRDAATAVMDPLLTKFGPELLNIVGGTDGLIDKFRETIMTLKDFDGAISAIAAVFAGGAIINAASGIVGTLVAARMIPMIGEAVRTIASPLKGLAGGMANLGKILGGGGLARSIGASVANAVGKIPGLASAAGGTALRAAGAVGVGYMAGEIAYEVDQQVSNYLYESTSKETKDAWYSFRKEGEGFFDFMAQNWKGVIQSGPNAGKNYWTGEQQFKQNEAGEWVETTEEERKASLEKPTEDPKVSNDVQAADVQADPAVEQIATLQEMQKSLEAQIGATPIDPVVDQVDIGSLNVDELVASMTASNTAMQTTIAATNSALERIYQVIKQNLDFDKESAAVVVGKLAELQRLNEDLVRSARRG